MKWTRVKTADGFTDYVCDDYRVATGYGERGTYDVIKRGKYVATYPGANEAKRGAEKHQAAVKNSHGVLNETLRGTG